MNGGVETTLIYLIYSLIHVIKIKYKLQNYQAIVI